MELFHSIALCYAIHALNDTWTMNGETEWKISKKTYSAKSSDSSTSNLQQNSKMQYQSSVTKCSNTKIS